MAIIYVKKYCVKKGVKYGPYPKAPDIYYVYRVFRSEGKVKQEYLGSGSQHNSETLTK